jgi:co-chaperonin GroES (HSP10)
MPKEEQLFQASNKWSATNRVDNIKPLGESIIVTEMDFSGRQLSSGIVLLSDDGKTEGIRPRWGRVYAVGPKQRDVKVGQWILLEHGRWSRGIKLEIGGDEFVARRADPKAILMVSDELPADIDGVSTAVYAEQKKRD